MQERHHGCIVSDRQVQGLAVRADQRDTLPRIPAVFFPVIAGYLAIPAVVSRILLHLLDLLLSPEDPPMLLEVLCATSVDDASEFAQFHA